MNNNIVPTGPQEVVVNGNLSGNILVLEAKSALTITNLIFIHQANPAHANAAAGLTLASGEKLYRVKSCTITGTAVVTYLGA